MKTKHSLIYKIIILLLCFFVSTSSITPTVFATDVISEGTDDTDVFAEPETETVQEETTSYVELESVTEQETILSETELNTEPATEECIVELTRQISDSISAIVVSENTFPLNNLYIQYFDLTEKEGLKDYIKNNSIELTGYNIEYIYYMSLAGVSEDIDLTIKTSEEIVNQKQDLDISLKINLYNNIYKKDYLVFQRKNNQWQELKVKDFNTYIEYLTDSFSPIIFVSAEESEPTTSEEILEEPDTTVEVETETETETSVDNSKNPAIAGNDPDKESDNVETEVTSVDVTADKQDNISDSSFLNIQGNLLKSIIIQKPVLTHDGYNYNIKVSFEDDSEIPVDSTLSVEEIISESEYNNYLNQAEDILGAPVSYARFFDIKIIHDENEIQPKEGSLVNVEIELLNEMNENLNIVHFSDEPEVLDASTENGITSFDTFGFSIYGIVEVAPAPPDSGWTRTSDLNNILDTKFYIGNPSEYYIINQTYHLSATQDLLSKIRSVGTPDGSTGALFSLEDVNGQYYISCKDNNGVVQYVKMSGNSLSYDTRENATLFDIEYYPNSADTFLISAEEGGTRYYWNQWAGAGGRGYGAYNKKNDINNALTFWIYNNYDDPFHLNGKSYGLMVYKDAVTAIGMLGEDNGNNRLAGVNMTIRTDPLDESETLFVSGDSDMVFFNFINISNTEYYLISEDGRYLTIDGTSVKLLDNPTDNSIISIRQKNGKIRLTNSSGQAVNLYGGSAEQGFGGYNDNGPNEWLNLAKKSVYNNEDFIIYSAKKVSISDTEQLTNHSKVLIYTRVWDDTKKEYKYYAIDSDGNLVAADESGETIRAVGLSVNNLVWDFTEYYYEGTTTPNYYYELQNMYSGQYLAPQIRNGQVLSDNTIGINLIGRQYDDNYSTILSWDDAYYDYAGLKIENNRLVSCPMAQSIDFFFAIFDEEQQDIELSTVDTIDNDFYGITMKMVDYNGQTVNRRNARQYTVLGADSNKAGLLQPYLEDDGYPLTVAEQTGMSQTSLSDLFYDATDANNLFIKAIYNESGYFEYDSTQNYAYLNDNGNFTVYNQLGTISTGNKSLNHGQFLPYNDLINPRTGEVYPYSVNHQNTTDINDIILPDSNLRKWEDLIEIPFASESYPYTNTESPYEYVDYFFGMEMDASFTQTVSGLDNWGHDIIFQFSGDDDMWLYVDDQLVLDLGGVHAAQSGTINFRTGLVTTSRGNSTLRELFEASYKAKYPNATNEEVEEYLDGYFKDGGTVFKDYSSHTMKMFYMERGAGASNLHLRFNLTYVKPGSVILNKKISGTEKDDYNLAEFPYQIYYKTNNSFGYQLMTQDMSNPRVVYQGTNHPVKYEAQFSPPGETIVYDNVFLLKPGQYAEIAFPDDTIDYYIVECGVNQHIYDTVKVNEIVLEGTQNGNRFDYATSVETVQDRPRVEYNNHVDEGALRTLTITKKLYKEDGLTELSADEDNTTFNFRVYLGSENEAEPALANMESYHIKNEYGDYCRWDFDSQSFVSINKNNYDLLTDEEKVQITFTTSANGAISRVPAGYSVEIRDLLIGTKFKIVERDNEIPEGYKLMNPGYVRVQGSYIIEDGDTENSGTIRDNSDPAIEVHNQRGWSLTVNKIWSDDDYMQSHDNVYLAVYHNGMLVSNTVKQLHSGQSSLSYYFDELLPDADFVDYEVQEVELTGDFTVDDNLLVTGYDSVTPIAEGNSINIGGIENDSDIMQTFTYNVSYSPGQATGANLHIRKDTVTNTRSGLKIIKTDNNDASLANAMFVLTDENEQPVGAGSYTSDANGLVTIAYLSDGIYTLRETKSPTGYQQLTDTLTIVKENGIYTINGDANAYIYSTSGEMPELRIKNRPFDLQIRKIDIDEDIPLEGVHFALYKQVSSINGPIKDFKPMHGYEDMITDENGYLNYEFEILPAGSYYLSETVELDGYNSLMNDICFTIFADGTIIMHDTNEATFEVDDTDGLTYLMTVNNSIAVHSLTISKTVTGNFGEKDKDFNFILTILGNIGNLNINYTKGDETGIVSFANRQFEFTLSHGDTIIFDGIPSTVRYTIQEVEMNQNGYTTTIDGESEGFLFMDKTVGFTNDREMAVPSGYSFKLNHIIIVTIGLLGFALLFILSNYFRKKE